MEGKTGGSNLKQKNLDTHVKSRISHPGGTRNQRRFHRAGRSRRDNILTLIILPWRSLSFWRHKGVFKRLSIFNQMMY